MADGPVIWLSLFAALRRGHNRGGVLSLPQQKTVLAPALEAESQDVDIVGEPSPAANLFDAQAAVDPSESTAPIPQVTAAHPVHRSSSLRLWVTVCVASANRKRGHAHGRPKAGRASVVKRCLRQRA